MQAAESGIHRILLTLARSFLMRSIVTFLGASLVLAAAAGAQDTRVVRETTTTVTREVQGAQPVQAVTPAHASLLELSRQVASGSDALREQVSRGEPQSGKLGQRILKNLLTGSGENREGRDPVYRQFDLATQELVAAAKELERASRESGREIRHDHDGRVVAQRADYDAGRRFIREFRTVDKLAGEVDRSLTGPTARGIFTNQVTPGLSGIRAELPTLAAFRDSRELRDDRHDEERHEDRHEDRHEGRREDHNGERF